MAAAVPIFDVFAAVVVITYVSGIVTTEIGIAILL